MDIRFFSSCPVTFQWRSSNTVWASNFQVLREIYIFLTYLLFHFGDMKAWNAFPSYFCASIIDLRASIRLCLPSSLARRSSFHLLTSRFNSFHCVLLHSLVDRFAPSLIDNTQQSSFISYNLVCALVSSMEGLRSIRNAAPKWHGLGRPSHALMDSWRLLLFNCTSLFCMLRLGSLLDCHSWFQKRRVLSRPLWLSIIVEQKSLFHKKSVDVLFLQRPEHSEIV